MKKKTKKTNYHKQRNGYSCAPIAILNMLVWGGVENPSYDNYYKELLKECKTDKEGTYDEDFEAALKKYCNKFGFKISVDINNELLVSCRLSEFLQKHNYAAIISHIAEDGDWHYSFWHDWEDQYFSGANVEYKSSKEEFTALEFLKIFLRKDKTNEHPYVWLIKKKN